MSSITVVCNECGQEVEGLIDAATTPDGEAFIMSGGFYLFENGVSCDDCVHGNTGPTGSEIEQSEEADRDV